MSLTQAQIDALNRADLNSIADVLRDIGLGTRLAAADAGDPGPKGIVTSMIDDGAVTEDQLGDAAVTTVKIGDAAVTPAKVANEAGIFRAFKALTNAELKALHATPIEVIGQP